MVNGKISSRIFVICYVLIILCEMSSSFMTKKRVISKGPSIKDVRKFSRFLTPTPLPSEFQKNAYEGNFWSLCTMTFWPSAHGDTPSPLRRTDVLNGWSSRAWLSGNEAFKHKTRERESIIHPKKVVKYILYIIFIWVRISDCAFIKLLMYFAIFKVLRYMIWVIHSSQNTEAEKI